MPIISARDNENKTGWILKFSLQKFFAKFRKLIFIIVQKVADIW